MAKKANTRLYTYHNKNIESDTILSELNQLFRKPIPKSFEELVEDKIYEINDEDNLNASEEDIKLRAQLLVSSDIEANEAIKSMDPKFVDKLMFMDDLTKDDFEFLGYNDLLNLSKKFFYINKLSTLDNLNQYMETWHHDDSYTLDWLNKYVELVKLDNDGIKDILKTNQLPLINNISEMDEVSSTTGEGVDILKNVNMDASDTTPTAIDISEPLISIEGRLNAICSLGTGDCFLTKENTYLIDGDISSIKSDKQLYENHNVDSSLINQYYTSMNQNGRNNAAAELYKTIITNKTNKSKMISNNDTFKADSFKFHAQVGEYLKSSLKSRNYDLGVLFAREQGSRDLEQKLEGKLIFRPHNINQGVLVHFNEHNKIDYHTNIDCFVSAESFRSPLRELWGKVSELDINHEQKQALENKIISIANNTGDSIGKIYIFTSTSITNQESIINKIEDKALTAIHKLYSTFGNIPDLRAEIQLVNKNNCEFDSNGDLKKVNNIEIFNVVKQDVNSGNFYVYSKDSNYSNNIEYSYDLWRTNREDISKLLNDIETQEVSFYKVQNEILNNSIEKLPNNEIYKLASIIAEIERVEEQMAAILGDEPDKLNQLIKISKELESSILEAQVFRGGGDNYPSQYVGSGIATIRNEMSNKLDNGLIINYVKDKTGIDYLKTPEKWKTTSEVKELYINPRIVELFKELENKHKGLNIESEFDAKFNELLKGKIKNGVNEPTLENNDKALNSFTDININAIRNI